MKMPVTRLDSSSRRYAPVFLQSYPSSCGSEWLYRRLSQALPLPEPLPRLPRPLLRASFNTEQLRILSSKNRSCSRSITVVDSLSSHRGQSYIQCSNNIGLNGMVFIKEIDDSMAESLNEEKTAGSEWRLKKENTSVTSVRKERCHKRKRNRKEQDIETSGEEHGEAAEAKFGEEKNKDKTKSENGNERHKKCAEKCEMDEEMEVSVKYAIPKRVSREGKEDKTYVQTECLWSREFQQFDSSKNYRKTEICLKGKVSDDAILKIRMPHRVCASRTKRGILGTKAHILRKSKLHGLYFSGSVAKAEPHKQQDKTTNAFAAQSGMYLWKC